MLELFLILILLSSAIAMAVMMLIKTPVLVKLKNVEIDPLQGIKQRGKKFFRLFSRERLLYKILSKFKVLILKTENKTSMLLANLRQKSIEEKSKFSDDYWKKLKRKK